MPAVSLSNADLNTIAQRVADKLATSVADKLADGLLAAAEARARAVALAGDDALVDEDEAASILATRPKSLQHWRGAGFGPRVIRISPNRVAYRIGDLKAFIASAARGPKTPPTIVVAAR